MLRVSLHAKNYSSLIHLAVVIQQNLHFNYTECSDSVGRVLDCCEFENHRQQSHCIVSLSITLYPLLSTASTQEDRNYF